MIQDSGFNSGLHTHRPLKSEKPSQLLLQGPKDLYKEDRRSETTAYFFNDSSAAGNINTANNILIV